MGANTFNVSKNYGKHLKNLVFLDLKREGYEVYYYNTSQGYEVDFVAVSKDGKHRLIQVVWDLDDDKTSKREKRALMHAEIELGIPGEIIDLSRYLSEL